MIQSSEEIRMHRVEFSLRGVFTSVPAYQSGDCIDYGGAVYRPTVAEVLKGDGSGSTFVGMVHFSGDGTATWGWCPPGGHKAAIYTTSGRGAIFYCS